MTEYMKEVLDWMCGEKSKLCPQDIWSTEAKDFHKMQNEVNTRCAPYITDEDIEEAMMYCSKNHGGFMGMAVDAYARTQVYPARERLKKQKEKRGAKND